MMMTMGFALFFRDAALLIFDCIKQHYRPYDTHAEFGRGFSACLAGDFRNPHEAESISAKAWDRGVEAAMVYKKASAA